MKRAIRCSALLLTALCAGIFGFCARLGYLLPDEFTAYGSDVVSFTNFSTLSFHNQSKNITAVRGDVSCCGDVSLFDIIPVKSVTVHRSEKKYVVPCGTLFGIKFYAKGAAVIRLCEIDEGGQTVCPGRDAGLLPGDTILKADGSEIRSCGDVERLTSQSGGEALHLLCRRGGRDFETDIVPAASDGSYRLGLWIKDSAAGLGTMTFYDPESGAFASLGHGICDDETGELLELDEARITAVEIAGITRGTDGCPGSINGYFRDGGGLGCATANSECGLYGTLSEPISKSAPVELAPIQEVHRGRAQILCTLDGCEPQLYDIEITKVDYDEKNKTKNLQITATDEELLQKTGGIVQGMSGCPILQNGKLAGAVTHVLITNSAKGYGIFAQNMFDEMEKAQNYSQ